MTGAPPDPPSAPPGHPVRPTGCLAGCWACCHDRTGTGRWVELGPADSAVPQSLTWTDGEGRRYLRTRPGGACQALEAGLCTIYAARPQVCRDFEAGSWQCDSARARFQATPAR